MISIVIFIIIVFFFIIQAAALVVSIVAWLLEPDYLAVFLAFYASSWLLSSSALQLSPPVLLSWHQLSSSFFHHPCWSAKSAYTRQFKYILSLLIVKNEIKLSKMTLVAQKSCLCFLYQIILINLSALTLLDWNAVGILALFQIPINLIVVACIQTLWHHLLQALHWWRFLVYGLL